MASYHFNKALLPIGYQVLFDTCFSCFLAHVFQPIKLSLVHVSLVFLHMFFLAQHGFTCSSIQQKNMSMFFQLLELFYVLLSPSRFKI
jgi:hypothetical protein